MPMKITNPDPIYEIIIRVPMDPEGVPNMVEHLFGELSRIVIDSYPDSR